jgi:hypothetical protein
LLIEPVKLRRAAIVRSTNPARSNFFFSTICYAGLREHSLRREIMIVLITVVRIGAHQQLRTKDQGE